MRSYKPKRLSGSRCQTENFEQQAAVLPRADQKLAGKFYTCYQRKLAVPKETAANVEAERNLSKIPFHSTLAEKAFDKSIKFISS